MVSEIEDGLTSGLVSLDANVLLSFYRFGPAARMALAEVLAALGDRVFVSHQAAREFWRNRLGAIDARNAAAEQLTAAIDKAQNQVQDAVKVWSKHTAADRSTEQQILKEVRESLDRCVAMAEDENSDASTYAYDVTKDSVVQTLLPLLEGRVGEPLQPSDHADAIKEASRRAAEQVPPGFRDAAKETDGAVDGASGDYLVWLQSMLEAKYRGLNLVLVTGDEKDDWWWKHRGQILGPRPELIEEFHKLSGMPLTMLRPSQLIDHAGVLKVSVTEDARSEVERGTTDAEWSEDAVAELLDRLELEGREQADVIRAAAHGGGSIERDALYAICDFAPDRMLRGFTRPTARITRDLVAEGILNESVTPMLTPIYESGVQAVRFEIPDEVTSILRREARPQPPADVSGCGL